MRPVFIIQKIRHFDGWGGLGWGRGLIIANFELK
jgi:hypothetical protein